MKNSKIARTLSALAISTMLLTGNALPAFAANGVQSGTQSFSEGTANINLSYSTIGGKWIDADDNTEHDNGTYVVKIPTSIEYETMNIGAVNTNDDYSVKVVGAIPANQNVTLTANTGQALSNSTQLPTDTSNITETTSIKSGGSDTAGAYSNTNKRTFTAAECSDGMTTEGKINGTTTTDNISMTGNIYTEGTWTGTVTYTAATTE